MRILIVDDSAMNRKVLRFTLEAGQHTTAEAEDGIEALAALQRQPIDLVISDVLMPNMDGYTLCSEVCRRVEFDQIPFILYSVADLSPDAEKVGLELGADRIIKKHGSANSILNAIEEIKKEGKPRRSTHSSTANDPPAQKVMKQYNELLIRRLEDTNIELEQTRDELRSLNQELEQRVAQRTRELREKNEQIEEDLKMARELQMALLPQQFPSIPHGVPLSESAIKFSSFFYPTGSVSGDFYFISRRSDTAVDVLIADVMGHGVRAGLVTAMMRALVEKFSATSADPAAMLSKINSSLIGILRHTGITLFATAFYLIADLKRSRMLYANAGHPKPLLLHRGRNELEQMSSKDGDGPALGLFDGMEYRTSECPLEVDDFVMLFTDGLFEVEAPNHELYSCERLIDAVRQRARLQSSELFAGVFAEIRQFSKRTEFSDDVCLLGMEVTRLAEK
jgi:serine phosphatase RsbU (regulator of sigma subunit)/FixJ family two-component response regulator